MADLADLAFHVQYHRRVISCHEAGHDPPECGWTHSVATGEATLTLAGPAQLIREAAALVFPHLATVFNPPPAEQPMAQVHQSHRLGALGPFDDQRCSQCSQVVISHLGTTPMGAAPCPACPTSSA